MKPDPLVARSPAGAPCGNGTFQAWANDLSRPTSSPRSVAAPRTRRLAPEPPRSRAHVVRCTRPPDRGATRSRSFRDDRRRPLRRPLRSAQRSAATPAARWPARPIAGHLRRPGSPGTANPGHRSPQGAGRSRRCGRAAVLQPLSRPEAELKGLGLEGASCRIDIADRSGGASDDLPLAPGDPCAPAQIQRLLSWP